MSEARRFDTRGYLVRLIFGRRPQVFQIPGIVQPKIWRFTNGIAIRDQSLTVALDQIEELANLRRQIGGEDDDR